MNPIKRLGLIIAMALTIDAIIIASALAQQSEADALNARVMMLYRLGKFDEAVPLAQRALALAEKAFGPDLPDAAPLLLSVPPFLNNLAELYRRQGRYADAEPLFKRSLAMREKVHGPDHPDVAAALGGLAKLYHDQGRYADAEPLYKQALAIEEKVLGPGHRDVARPC
jgi:tetratricopeptide (TPR) repeat protein